MDDGKIIDDSLRLLRKYNNKDLLRIMNLEGFFVDISKLTDYLDGYVSVNNKNIEKFGFDKVIGIKNSLDVDMQQFVLANQYAHYYYDYLKDRNGVGIYCSIYTISDSIKDYKDIRANLFANSLLYNKQKVLKK